MTDTLCLGDREARNYLCDREAVNLKGFRGPPALFRPDGTKMNIPCQAPGHEQMRPERSIAPPLAATRSSGAESTKEATA
ncbi:MAG: hypothetical protein LAN84_12445 [Acidobacteriia bacterium]|nr:hypothetical protein [Terriglobia bacterium]